MKRRKEQERHNLLLKDIGEFGSVYVADKQLIQDTG